MGFCHAANVAEGVSRVNEPSVDRCTANTHPGGPIVNQVRTRARSCLSRNPSLSFHFSRMRPDTLHSVREEIPQRRRYTRIQTRHRRTWKAGLPV